MRIKYIAVCALQRPGAVNMQPTRVKKMFHLTYAEICFSLENTYVYLDSYIVIY